MVDYLPEARTMNPKEFFFAFVDTIVWCNTKCNRMVPFVYDIVRQRGWWVEFQNHAYGCLALC
jgi:hypothetical protein